jgi:hypothetical protein
MSTTTRTLSDYFERRTRDNGESFYTLADGTLDWLHDAVREAHDGELPNDWRYEICAHIVSSLEDDPDADAAELADSLVDVYNVDRVRWLAEDISRAAYVDEADGPDDDVIGRIGYGQYVCIDRMVSILADAIEENRD